MNQEDRVVIKIPVEKLWNSQTELDLERVSYLTKTEMKQMLRTGPVQFVIADVGEKLVWPDQSDAYSFWKNEVEPHFIENPGRILPGEFSNEYAYLVSYWSGMTNGQVVLLEKVH